jgi:hypothetical protein
MKKPNFINYLHPNNLKEFQNEKALEIIAEFYFACCVYGWFLERMGEIGS